MQNLNCMNLGVRLSASVVPRFYTVWADLSHHTQLVDCTKAAAHVMYHLPRFNR